MKSRRPPLSLAIVSGKGGVGKSNIASNLSIMLSSMGKRVLLVDGDMGLGNIDVLLGLTPSRTIKHVIEGSCELEDIVVEGPKGISIIPACSAELPFSALTPSQFENVRAAMRRVSMQYEYAIMDSPPGISANMQQAALLADEIFILTTPEPTAVIDAYAVAKQMSLCHQHAPLKLIVNMISNQDAGERVANGLREAVSRFLKRDIEPVASLPFDPCVGMAVRRQQPFTLCYPNSPASRSIRTFSLRMIAVASRLTAASIGGFELNQRLSPHEHKWPESDMDGLGEA